MIRLIIVCEGETEQEFCKHILAPHLLRMNIVLEFPLVKRSGGGIGSWESLKKQIKGHLSEANAYVSLFIDMYGIKDSYNFPNWLSSKVIGDVKQRMRDVECGMEIEIGNPRFIPNIIVHEFETILFSDGDIVKNQIPKNELNETDLDRIISSYPDIELINNGATTAPSKRLEIIIKGYVKSIYGHYLAEEIGLVRIRTRCFKFDQWIIKLEALR